MALGLGMAASDAGHAMQGTYIDVNATVTSNPSQVTFTWDSQQSGTTVATIDISRRTMEQSGVKSWKARGSVAAPGTSFTDSITAGTVYEYKIHRPAINSTYKEVSAFVTVTLNAPLTDTRGRILLVTDTNQNTPLAGELRQLEMDLAGDGWTVQRIDSPPHLSGTAGISRATALRSAIQSAYNADPSNTKALYLFGSVPVVKSGYLNADGHGSKPHETDGFFADVNGTWTDSTVNVAGVNVPGDGIYDQSYFPSVVELMAGRVDFANMIAYHKENREYLRDYIHKSHAFRYGQRIEVPRHGSWNSGYLWPERNWINPLFGTANVTYAPFQPLLSTSPQLFAIDFGDYNGAGLNYTGTANKLIFGINFGSGKLFWYNTNNPMRGLLAQPDWGMTCVWGARPSWFFHHMGGGLPVGYSALRTINNNYNISSLRNDYAPVGDYSYMAGYVLETLMGDPTLRLHPVAPASNVAVGQAGGSALLTWTASPDGLVSGYHIYRSSNRLGPYNRLTSQALSGTSYTDGAPPAGDVYYQVRAIKTDTTPASTYVNSSQGAFARLNADRSANRVPVAFSSVIDASSDQTWEVVLTGSDSDGDALTPIITSNPANGKLRWNGAQVVYVPKLGYTGSDSVQYVMSDGVTVSEPATVSIPVSPSRNIVEWEFITTGSNGEPQVLTSSFNAAGILPSVISIGSGLRYSNGQQTYTSDALPVSGAASSVLNANDYIEWTIQPEAGQQMDLDQISMGFWTYSASTRFTSELRWSADGFVTSQTVPLGSAQVTYTGRGTSNFYGMPFTGDLSVFPALQNCATAITFRLYVWGANSDSVTIGIGKLGDTFPDLIVSGSLSPL